MCAPQHPMARTRPSLRQLREQQWFLDRPRPAADGVMRHMLRALDIPHERQRIFQSDAAAVEAVRRSSALTLALGFAIDDELSPLSRPRRRSELRAAANGAPRPCTTSTSSPPRPNCLHFVSTPRCIQAMIRGTGVDVTHFQTQVCTSHSGADPGCANHPDQQVCSWPRLRSSVG